MHVKSEEEFEDELKSHAIHMRHGEHRDDAVAGLHFVTENANGEVIVRPQSAIRNQHTF